MRNNDVLSYFKQNTDTEITDLFKFLYQSCFGCEHLVTDYDRALKWIKEEYESAEADDLPEVEYLDGDFCRVHLKALRDEQSLETLCEVFIKSSGKREDGLVRLEKELAKLVAYSKNRELRFSEEELAEAIEKWRAQGFPAIHHSEKFRKAHNPAYRVIKKEYLEILGIL